MVRVEEMTYRVLCSAFFKQSCEVIDTSIGNLDGTRIMTGRVKSFFSDEGLTEVK